MNSLLFRIHLHAGMTSYTGAGVHAAALLQTLLAGFFVCTFLSVAALGKVFIPHPTAPNSWELYVYAPQLINRLVSCRRHD